MNKTYKYQLLHSFVSGATPTVAQMLPAELALTLNDNDTRLFTSDGTKVVDLGAKLGGKGDNLTVHSELVNGVKEFSTIVRMKKITSADTAEWAAMPANVRDRYKLVDVNGDNIIIESGVTPSITADTPSEYIDIYKESSLQEIYVGVKYDSVDSGSGIVTKYSVGDVVEDPDTHQPHTIVEEDFQYLNFVYINSNGNYYMTKINLNDFITEREFASGITWDSQENKVRGVIDEAQDLLITEWTDGDYTNAGVSAVTESGLTVGEDGFNLEYVQDAINAKHANTIKMNGYTSAMTGNDEDLFEIVSGDTVMQAISKIEKKLVSNGSGNAAGGGVEENNTGLVFVEGSPELVIFSAGSY